MNVTCLLKNVWGTNSINKTLLIQSFNIYNKITIENTLKINYKLHEIKNTTIELLQENYFHNIKYKNIYKIT